MSDPDPVDGPEGRRDIVLQERLRRRTALLARTERLAHVGSVLWDLERDEIHVSEGWRRINGWGDAELDAASMMALVHPDDRERVERAHEESLRTGRPFDLEHRIVRRDDGAVRTVQGYGDVERDAAGRPLRIYGAIQDVTDRVRLEHERRELEERIRQGQKLEAVGRLAAGVAHEFNNLLTVVLSNAELLRAFEPARDQRADPRGDAIAGIEDAAEQAAGLVRQLLAVGRRQELRPEVLDLGRALDDAAKMLRPLLGDALRLTLHDGSVGAVWADPQQIAQVLLNLAINARDAMPDGGELRIATCRTELTAQAAAELGDLAPGPYACLCVSDTGAGIEPSQRSRIFEPFFTTKGTGTGLGLPVVHGIVSRAGGGIRVESEPERGTTVTVLLPLYESPDDARTPAHGADAAAEVRAGPTLLLCDDDPALLPGLARALAGHGFHVLSARCGRDAVERARRAGPVDALVTDVVMPDMSGPALATVLHRGNPELRVLFLSGSVPGVSAPAEIASDRIAFLAKPCTAGALAERVRKLLAS